MKTTIVRHRDETSPLECPFGHVQRIVTGGEGGIANVHVAKITKGRRFWRPTKARVFFRRTVRAKATPASSGRLAGF
jgi:hypothetical protein